MYYTVIKHSGHLRTLEKCRKRSPAARVFYISLVFSNAHRVLSQCNTRLRLLYLLNIQYDSTFTQDLSGTFTSCSSFKATCSLDLRCTSLILDIHVMLSWHLSIQGIRWPVSRAHIAGSRLELIEVTCFLEVNRRPSAGFFRLDRGLMLGNLLKTGPGCS